MSEIFTKIGGYIASGDPLVYADSASMTGDGTVASPFGVNKMDMFVQAPLFTGTSGEGDNTSAYIGCNNETVLLDRGTDDLVAPNTAQLAEPFSAFDKIEMWCVWNPWPSNVPQATYYPGNATEGAYMVFDNSQFMRAGYGLWRVTGTTIQLISAAQTTTWPTFQEVSTGLGGIRKIVGINRKA